MDLKSLHLSSRALAVLVVVFLAASVATPAAQAQNTAPTFNTPQVAMPPLTNNGGIPMTEDGFLTIAVNVAPGSSDAELLKVLDIQDAEEDDEDLGIAVTAWSGNGRLQYLNASSAWVNLPTVSATNPFLLGPSDRLRYEGDDKNGEIASLTFLLWDGTEGTARATFAIAGSTAFSSQSRTSSIPVSSVQDPAQLNGAPASVTGNDNAEIQPFTAVTVDDVDLPADTLTVRVTVSPTTNGTLSQRGSHGVAFTETGIGTGVYTATGSEANVEAALKDLAFQPVSNLAPVGSTTTTGLSLTVSDGQPPPGNDDTASINVVVTSVNDAPVITPEEEERFVFTRGTIVPFQGFTISDADIVAGGGRQTVSFTVTEPITAADGSFVLANGTSVSGNTVTFTALSIEAALTELTGLRYVATSATLATPVTVALSLVVTDVASGSSTATVDVTVATPKISSNIRGTESGQVILDTGVRRLFENVTITGTNVASLEVVAEVATGDLAGDNALTLGVGDFVQTGPDTPFARVGDTLVFTGPASEAAVALNALAFKPVPNMFSQVETVQFSLKLLDAGSLEIGTDSRTTAEVVPVNDLPTFIKFEPLNPIQDSETTVPFRLVKIGDADEKGNQELDVTIEVLSSLPDGTTDELVPGGLSHILASGFTETPAESGKYVFTGSPADATTAIQDLRFTPEANRLQPGMNETVTFRVSLDDRSGDVVVRDQVKVLVISENDPPEVEDPPSGRIEVMADTDILPFGDAGTTLDDVDVNDEITVRIQLDSPEMGLLVDSRVGSADVSFVESPVGSGIYLASGPAASVQAALRALQFDLKPGYPVPAGEPGITVEFLVTVTDRQAGKYEFSFSMLVRVDQVTRVVVNLDDSGPGSLRQAIADASDNDHIAFDLDEFFALEPRLVLRLQSPLVIDKNLTIAGPGVEKLVISGDSDSDGTADVQLFQVGMRGLDETDVLSAYLHLSYLTLAQGSDEQSDFGNGGAVSVGPGSTLILDHAEVLDCVAEQWGGAIDVEDGRLSVSHTLFAGNATGLNLGQGGGAISVYSNYACTLANVTFSGNRQGGASGTGGGALYFENSVPTRPFDVSVRHCTFEDNADAAGKGSSIRTNVFNTLVTLQNNLFADGDANPLDPSGAGRILSAGGNVADDDAMVWISQGGAPLALHLLDDQSDQTSQVLPLEPLADNGGQTRTHALPAGSPARVAGLLNSGTPTDQRDVVRAATPDAGAFEAGAFTRFVINEVHFDPAAGESAYVEIVNPRDSQTADLANYELWVSGVKKHVFLSQLLAPGTAVLITESGLTVVPTPPGAFFEVGQNRLQSASENGFLGLGLTGGIVEIRTPGGAGIVASATYLAKFQQSGGDGSELRGTHESVTRNCEFLGGLQPGPRTPGEDSTNTPLLEGNAPPIAYDDELDSDEDTAIEIDVLANDFDADRTDVIRVESLPAATSALGAALSIVDTPSSGAAVAYDPTLAPAIQAIPLGGEAEDTFDYVILDYANGTTPNSRVRTPPITPANQAEADANILRATGTVTIRIVGINDAPTPADDSAANLPSLATTEDTVLSFAADTLLDNDTDPDVDPVFGEGGRALRICWVKPPDFDLGDKDPSRVELSDLETETALGARVVLTLRADRSLSSISYDPRGSAALNALAQGEPAVDSFSYLVIDKHGAPGLAKVFISVTGVNDAPVANGDGPFATHEDAALDIAFDPDVLGNDTDVDQNGVAPDDVLAVQSADVISRLGAVVTRLANRFVYDPRASALLQTLSKKEIILDDFAYVVSDGNGGNSTALVTVRVTGMNDQPVADNDVAFADEDNEVNIAASEGVLVNDTDIDMNNASPDDMLRALPVGTFTSVLGATVRLYADGSFDYLPNGLFEGLGQGETKADSFQYTATDDGLVYANGDSYRVAAGQSGVLLPVLQNDVNLGVDPSQSLVVTQVGVPNQGGVVAIVTGGTGVLYTPAFGFVGTETFTYQVAAGPYGFCLAEVSVEVVPSSGPITGRDDVFTVVPNGTASLDVLANDVSLPGGVSVALTAVSDPDQGGTATIVLQGGRTLVRYAPAAGFTGVESFTYEATAGGGTEFTASVTVTVPNRAGLLRAQDDAFYVVKDTTANPLPVLANDGVLPATASGWSVNPGALSALNPASAGTVAVSADGRSIDFTPAAGYSGEASFSYGVVDAFGGTGTASVIVTVGPEDFVAQDDHYAVNRNSTSNTLPVLANDVLLPNTGERIQITFLNDPPNGTAVWNAARSAIVYTPDSGFSGVDSFDYEIGTAAHPRRVATLTVDVIDRSLEIPGAADAYSVAGDSTRNALRVLANDGIYALGGLPLVVTSFGAPSQGGSLEIASGGEFLFYTPAPGFIGTETFTYAFSDGRGGTGNASVTVKVGTIFAGNDVFTVLSGQSTLLDVLANDRRIPGGLPDLQGTTTAPSQGGSAVPNGDTTALVYTPAAGFIGLESFSYIVRDDTGGTYQAAVLVRVVPAGSDHDTATVVVTVRGANDAPTLTGVQPIDFLRDDRVVKPFANVTIGEVDSNGQQLLTVKVVMDDPDKGDLEYVGTNPPPPAFIENPEGTYTFIGTAADATAALRNLCFVPTDNRLDWSEHETTTLTLCISDGIAPEIKNSGTTIEVYNIGQLFADNWIFGNGITLSWNERRALTVGRRQPFGFPLGGGGSWSDPSTGEWLLYTDGVSAWNARTGAVVAGANGTLGGATSEASMIPAMVVAKPGGDPSKNLFVFAFGAQNRNIHLTEIDLSLGAHGSIVGTAGREVVGSSPSQEGWVLVPHDNSNDYWLVLGNGNAYPVKQSGVGIPVTNFNLDGSGASFRYSPDRKRIAVGWSSPKMYLYDFNAGNGRFSASRIELPRGSVFFEFSHDGKKLYVNDTVAQALYQYDLGADPGPTELTATRTAAVQATEVLLHSYASPDFAGDMALGPDNRIYIAGDGSSPPKLHVINEPDAAGAASLLALDAVTLPADGILRQGLYHGLRTDDLIRSSTMAPSGPFEGGRLSAVSTEAWTTVTLNRSYGSMVVVATPEYATTAPMAVTTQIRNAVGSQFEVRLARTGIGTTAVALPVHYVVAEEGQYSVPVDGIKMEAVRYTSTVTDRKASWTGEARSYRNSYSSPVVLGQVMTANDARPSIFWARGNNSSNPPSSGSLFTGKHIGADTVLTRLPETIGYIVIEAGQGTLLGTQYSAFTGADSVRGISDAPPYTYPVTGVPSPTVAVASSAAMDDSDGGWPVLYGLAPLTTTSVGLAIVEDQWADSERSHSTEQAAVLVLGGAGMRTSLLAVAQASLAEWRQQHFTAEVLADPDAAASVWGMEADAEGDGRSNMEEYAFGSDPWNHDGDESVRIWIDRALEDGESRVHLMHVRRTGDVLMRYVLEVSSDMMQWEPAAAREVRTLVLEGGSYEAVTLTLDSPAARAGGFYRIKALR